MNHRRALPLRCDVAIVGGGPAGISAATELRRLGVSDVHVVEREPEAGGIPRHCGHPPFGFREFRRIYRGPEYARRLVADALACGVRVHTSTTVVRILPEGRLVLSDNDGVHDLEARRVLLCTGVRETPRSARLATGGRPAGIVTTGALQSTVYLAESRLFQRPVIVGTELVAFSALLTCRHAGIKPVAMIEANHRPTAFRASSLLPRSMGVDLRLETRLLGILGTRRVEAVEIAGKNGNVETLSCDGVVFTGGFVPEATLVRMSHLELDPCSGGPNIDEFGRCSDPAYFAAGNLLRPVETAGWCWSEGRRAALALRDDLDGSLPQYAHAVPIVPDHPVLKYVVPQRVSTTAASCKLQLRVRERAHGRLSFVSNGAVVLEKRIDALPERRLLVELKRPAAGFGTGPVRIEFHPS